MNGSSPSLPSIYEREPFWAMLVHISALTGYLTFVGFFLGPAIVRLVKRDDFPELDAHFRKAINFQISMLAYAVLAVILILFTLGVGALLAARALWLISILNVVFTLMAGFFAYEERPFRYPLSIRLMK